MSKDSISWTSFCQVKNSIAYWLIQNKKIWKLTLPNIKTKRKLQRHRKESKTGNL